MHWVRDAALILALLWLLLVALTTVRAQEPTPTTEAVPCVGFDIEGGMDRTIVGVQVTLPPGAYKLTIPPPDPGDQNFALCHVSTGGVLNMDATNCEMFNRFEPNAQAEAIFDVIVESCRIAPTPTPDPLQPFACPGGEAVEGGGTVTIAGNLQVSLPPGNFLIDVDAEADGEIATICNPDEEYSVILRVADCTTPVIAPPTDPAQAVKQEIKASCITLAPTPTPDPAAVVANIQPPNTGDAGLRD